MSAAGGAEKEEVMQPCHEGRGGESERHGNCLGEVMVKSGGIWLKHLRSGPSELESMPRPTAASPGSCSTVAWGWDPPPPHTLPYSPICDVSVSLIQW